MRVKLNHFRMLIIAFLMLLLRRFQHANAPPAKLKNIFVKTLKRGTKI